MQFQLTGLPVDIPIGKEHKIVGVHHESGRASDTLKKIEERVNQFAKTLVGEYQETHGLDKIKVREFKIIDQKKGGSVAHCSQAQIEQEQYNDFVAWASPGNDVRHILNWY
jgi:hypothetical protein